jgi:hypothetical protein
MHASEGIWNQQHMCREETTKFVNYDAGIIELSFYILHRRFYRILEL